MLSVTSFASFACPAPDISFSVDTLFVDSMGLVEFVSSVSLPEFRIVVAIPSVFAAEPLESEISASDGSVSDSSSIPCHF